MLTMVRTPLRSPGVESTDEEDEEWPPAHLLRRMSSPSSPGGGEPEHDVPVAFVEHPSRVWLRAASVSAAEEPHPLGRRMCFDVSGTFFETWSSSLQRFGRSWLANLQPTSACFVHQTGAYTFGRNAATFECVVNYLSTGELHRPHEVCRHEFLLDIAYFGVDASALQTCCRSGATRRRKRVVGDPVVRARWQYCIQKALTDRRRNIFEAAKQAVMMARMHESSWSRLRRLMWGITDGTGLPLSSAYYKLGRVLNITFAILTLSFILLSVGAFVIATLPEYRRCEVCDPTQADTNWLTCPKTKVDCDGPNSFFIIETVCVAWFTFELILRFICCPDRFQFWRDPLNIIDVLAILPYYVSLGLTSAAGNIAIIRILRLLRVLRIFKLARHFAVLRILGLAIIRSLKELTLLLFLLSLGVVIFASCVFFAEKDSNNTLFLSIPDSFWWAIITMTTVGYGDMAPVTLAGRIIGGLCVVSGLLIIALPVPIFVNNFTVLYENYVHKKEQAAAHETARRRAKHMEDLRVRMESIERNRLSRQLSSRALITNGEADTRYLDDGEFLDSTIGQTSV
eukprot:m.89349 g.89349  ORF g.89349 m.89349 type:complete len:569 (+) comp13655_c0_seq3:234-1940(+)